MTPFPETEFRAMMMDARKLIWKVAEEQDSRKCFATYMACALADMEEAVARGLKTIQSQQALLDAHLTHQVNAPDEPSASMFKCPWCDGTGASAHYERVGAPLDVRRVVGTCPKCNGRKFVRERDAEIIMRAINEIENTPTLDPVQPATTNQKEPNGNDLLTRDPLDNFNQA